MSCNKCNNIIDACDCNTTTTTTCSDVAQQPCVTICSDFYGSECIIYDGEDNDCYGVKKGDTIKNILDKIIAKITPDNCSCDYGNATIDFITTTTSSTTTTTTTILPDNLCITIYEANKCNFTLQEITPDIFINGKESYTFTYNSINYVIRWSIVDERWELFLASNFTFALAYLTVDSERPIGPLMAEIFTKPELSWTMYGVDSILVTTREYCSETICATVEVEIVGDSNFINISLKSPYDTLASLPSQPINLKHYYIGCIDEDVIEIKWNLFANRYEAFYNGSVFAFTLQNYLENTSQIDWVMLPEQLGSPFYSLKTTVGDCPITINN